MAKSNQLNLTVGEDYKKILGAIINHYKNHEDPTMNASKYLRNHIKNDFKRLFRDHCIKFEGLEAIFVSQEDLEEMQSLLDDFREKGIEIDSILFEALAKKSSGFIVWGEE